MKPDRVSAAVGCGCGSSDHLLHSIRHRGAFLRLCTSCVLRFHLGSFCPICLQLFDRSPPSDSVQCSKCPSFSHSACVGQAAEPSYICSCCENPNFLVFGSSPDEEEVRRALDLKSVKALVAAAQIASLSMSRAAAAARVEAERKARESALARKRAKEALERVAFVALRRESQEAVLVKDKKTSKGISTGASVAPQKRIQVRKLGGGLKICALSNLGIRETGKLVRLQGKDAFGGSISVSGRHNFQNYGTMGRRKKLGDSSLRDFHDMQGAKEKKQVISGQSLLGNHVMADDGGKLKGAADSGLGPAQLLSLKKGE